MTLLAGCFPFYKYWQFYPDPGSKFVHGGDGWSR